MSSPHSSPEGHGGVSCGNGLNFDPSLREEGAFSVDGETHAETVGQHHGQLRALGLFCAPCQHISKLPTIPPFTSR
ncbi:unnamed protein product [Boreogadus saida]